ncbi:MAG: hypothetical protein GYB37_01330 [Algicola sp.]|nr:hypothetical protein [Algicola sp.]
MYPASGELVAFKRILKARSLTLYNTDQQLRQLTPLIFYFGACCTVFLTFLSTYINIHKREFLFFSLHILFSAIYLIDYNIPELSFIFESKLLTWATIVSSILFHIFYLLFAKFYLNTPLNYPSINIGIDYTIISLLVLIILDFFAYFNSAIKTHEFILLAHNSIIYVLYLFGLIYLLFKFKDILVRFFVFGSLMFVLSTFFYLLSSNKNLIMVGSIMEILIFSLGLAYKIKLDYEEKLNLQQEVSVKEIIALRSQMNPHFIFNSLNSIQHLILKNDRVSALSYLSKFSKLTRNVLESSHLTLVSLDEEISVIKSYLELESLRFDNSFKYTIEIEDRLDIENIEIPLMLIQPFVENALIHGLIEKKEGEKNLSIRFLREENYCLIIIEDNGIGRHHKKRIFKKSCQKSRGMEITEKRLQLLNTMEQSKNSVEIVDKYDSTGKPIGTKAVIKIHNP